MFAILMLCRAESALPEPPQQHALWQPLSFGDAPDFVPEVFGLLFEVGMADPRGGEYRQIELEMPPAKGRSASSRGWYFREGFAVGWDGFVHRVRKAGERLNLHSGVTAAIEAYPHGTVDSVPLTLVSASLLLRLGEPELAREVFLIASKSPWSRRPVLYNDPQLIKAEFFRGAAVGWLEKIFHQAVEAHATGHDRNAVEIADWLARGRGSRCPSGPPKRMLSHR